MKILALACIVWAFCILSSLYRYLRCLSLYKRFLSGKEMTTKISAVNELFHWAGTSYTVTYDMNRGGYTQRSIRDVAYLCDRKKHFSEINKVFLISKGIFQTRLIRSIFPIHAVFLPSYIIDRKQLSTPTVVRFFLTALYWLIDAFLGYNLNLLLDELYRSQFLEWLRVLLEEIA